MAADSSLLLVNTAMAAELFKILLHEPDETGLQPLPETWLAGSCSTLPHAMARCCR